MKREQFLLSVIAVLGLSTLSIADTTLQEGFKSPPNSAKLRAYWWWLNGNVTKESIERDLVEMSAKGFGGALICDANGANQFGNAPVPHGPTFFSPEWRDLYKFTLKEANRLHLEMSLNIQSGWNLGGPMVPASDAPKKLVYSSCEVQGSSATVLKLPVPNHDPALYGDVAVFAYPQKNGPAAKLDHFEEKALVKGLSWSAPDSSLLLIDHSGMKGEEATTSRQVLDLSSEMKPDGSMTWNRRGKWRIVRLGYTLNDHCRVSTNSEGWDGYAIDPFDRGAFMRYWNAVVEPLIQDAGPLAGSTLKYLHTDSWEVEVANWTPTLRKEFRQRRGYDMWPYLPVMIGAIVDSREKSNRFLNDLRRTIGDLAIDNHFKLFRDLAHRHGMEIHPESGGPHAVPIDSLECLGTNDAPMSEFWAGSWTHRVKDEDRFFVKQPATAAHTYGHRLVLAEGFTTIGPHWQETLWDNLKPNFDEACCQGLNRLVWHAFVCSPDSTGIPGQQYFAGTHLNPKVTWWPYSQPFFEYLNRCQFLLQQGRFVADALYYYGNHVPNFTQLESSDPAKVRPTYDYDVATEDVILHRLSVKDGRLTLPDGMTYRMLVLPDQAGISLPVLKKLKRLALSGAIIVGSPPTHSNSLTDYPVCDDQVRRIAGDMWSQPTSHPYGRGLIVPRKPGREVLHDLGIAPDFEAHSDDGLALNYIHRQTENADIYFVANRSKQAGTGVCRFRVHGRVAEHWNPVSGSVEDFSYWNDDGQTTTLPIHFDPCGSAFVVFRRAGHPKPSARPTANGMKESTVAFLNGAWRVEFDPKWGGPGEVTFDRLTDWSKNELDGIRFYSGTAVYRKEFDAPSTSRDVFLTIDSVHEVARVILNGQDLGVLWAPPFRVNLSKAMKPKANQLEIRVANFWPNRIIGDARNPGVRPLTQTNILGLKADTPLMPSGIVGDVRLVTLDKP